MRVKIWGCRGSIPVAGKDFLHFGGNTSCVEVTLSDGTTLILDAGSGLRNLGKNLMARTDRGEVFLYLSHSHWDHLMGFPYFAPAYSEKWTVNIRGGIVAKETLKNYFEHIMEPPYFPARMSAMKAQLTFTHGVPKVTRVSGAEVTPIPLSHPNGGYGFRIQENDQALVYLTDNELDFLHKGGATVQEYQRFCKDADLVLHDAQYTPEEYTRYRKWGHSSFVSAVQLAIASGAGSLALIHHDPDHSDENIGRIETTARAICAKRGSRMTCFAGFEGQEIVLP